MSKLSGAFARNRELSSIVTTFFLDNNYYYYGIGRLGYNKYPRHRLGKWNGDEDLTKVGPTLLVQWKK